MARPFHELLTDCSCSGQRSVVRGSNHFVCFKASKAESFGVYRHHTTQVEIGKLVAAESTSVGFNGNRDLVRHLPFPNSHPTSYHGTHTNLHSSVLKRAQAVRESDVDHDISSAQMSLEKLCGSSHRTVLPLPPLICGRWCCCFGPSGRLRVSPHIYYYNNHRIHAPPRPTAPHIFESRHSRVHTFKCITSLSFPQTLPALPLHTSTGPSRYNVSAWPADPAARPRGGGQRPVRSRFVLRGGLALGLTLGSWPRRIASPCTLCSSNDPFLAAICGEGEGGLVWL